ncbi:MAG: hypothetical protein JSS66_07490 [Armatimonadetes bacterium]|nr:hypothetical protein [Armatimonadota bacterium]
MTTEVPKKSRFRKGLAVSTLQWAQNCLTECQYRTRSKMDCATAHALHKLANGDPIQFVAYRFTGDHTECLAIYTPSLPVTAVSFGFGGYMEIRSVEQMAQSLYRHGHRIGGQLLAFRTADTERVYFEPAGIDDRVEWSEDAAALLAEAAMYAAEKAREEQVRILTDALCTLDNRATRDIKEELKELTTVIMGDRVIQPNDWMLQLLQDLDNVDETDLWSRLQQEIERESKDDVWGWNVMPVHLAFRLVYGDQDKKKTGRKKCH